MTAHPPNNRTGPDDEAALWSNWRLAVERPEIDSRIEQLYVDLDSRVRAKGPTCWTSGKCCNFDEYGHLLYVTGLEIAWVLRRLKVGGDSNQKIESGSVVSLDQLGKTRPPQRPWHPDSAADPAKGACRYQVNKLCTVHGVRPMGCRIYFCQEGTSQWQNELYEEFLGRLRALHEEQGIEYRYMEWRKGLIEAESSAVNRA